ncbi:protein MICROTUBULE BINDING PROTEIN 2C-like [Impatiens glandulifera]|uniref:protein MICROTUBULE BINDING PROTEIN 2C-like n=1 Tax=Impatiens glandulifera TaxID=253017 RepID=UPI001FB05656|nr:protein MICROTUBULE BINDING PROTEIN 2C-like [Impatiens glandulifera]
MYEPQHLADLQDTSLYGRESNSWLSAEDNSPSADLRRTLSSLSNAASVASGNVDPVLFNDLVEIVPLVQSLIDRKAISSFTRRGSVVYTKTPSKESRSKKISGRNTGQSFPSKNRRDQGENSSAIEDGGSSIEKEKEKEELIALKQQMEDLQQKLLEKDNEVVKSEQATKEQMNSIHSKLEEMRVQELEKDSILRSTQQQLADTKIKLADKQAAVERLQWETTTSSKKVEKLEHDLDSVKGEISSFMLFFESLAKNQVSKTGEEDYDVSPYYPCDPYQSFDDMEKQQMEFAREAYIAAVAVAKEKQDGDSIDAAERARLCLQSFVHKPATTKTTM